MVLQLGDVLAPASIDTDPRYMLTAQQFAKVVTLTLTKPKPKPKPQP